MKLSNRAPAEGINSTRDNPLREFAGLLLGSLLVLVAIVTLLSLGAHWLAPRLPYRHEAALAERIEIVKPPKDDIGRAALADLQALADRLARRMDLPAGMTVKVGYSDEGMVNAFATLGGNLVVFKGLLTRLDSEDALGMVMAHEMAHLRFRHPAEALGRGLSVGLVLAFISPDLGKTASVALGQAGLVTLMSFNREQERQADQEALRVVAAEYGHVGGAVDLFSAFESMQGAPATGIGKPRVEFFQTHPLIANRVEAAKLWAKANGVAVDGPRRPLSKALTAARSAPDTASTPAGKGPPGAEKTR